MKLVAYQWEVTLTYKMSEVETRREGITFGDLGTDWMILWQ